MKKERGLATCLLIKSKRSQLALFIIIALIVVVAIAAFFIFRDRLFPQNVSESIAPVYNYYTSCIQSLIEDGTKIAGTHAGYLENPEFKAGSTYAPFGSELGFLGQGIPYWYTISGNGVASENIPSIKTIESQFNNYLASQIGKCGLENFSGSSYEISLGKASFSTSIRDNKIAVKVNQRINIKRGEEQFSIGNFEVDYDSSFGKLYAAAKKLYDYEKKNMFLENYSVDVLYTYAPVSGVERNCSPIIWNPHEVFNRLRDALEANIQAITFSGDYYENTNQYFIAGKDSDLQIKDMQANFIYSRDWASRFEVWPTKNNLMVANPVGTQQGLGAMGLCYVSYKFVYDLYFPVLIQLYDNNAEELFQFPFAVVINKNVPRESIATNTYEQQSSICDNANTNITISTYNINLEPIEANLQFKCITDSCPLGKSVLNNGSKTASLTAMVPQCYNGILIADAPGYKQKKYTISTNEETSAEIVLDKEYKLGLEIYVDNVRVSDLAILNVEENDNSSLPVVTATSPFNKDLDLAEGDYIFDLKVFKSGGVTIPATTTRQCVETAKEGVLGFFGFTEDRCTDITIPSQQITTIPYAGGKVNKYVTQSELDKASILRVYAKSIKLPSNSDEIQESYDLIDENSLDIQIV